MAKKRVRRSEEERTDNQGSRNVLGLRNAGRAEEDGTKVEALQDEVRFVGDNRKGHFVVTGLKTLEVRVVNRRSSREIVAVGRGVHDDHSGEGCARQLRGS